MKINIQKKSIVYPYATSELFEIKHKLVPFIISARILRKNIIKEVNIIYIETYC